MQLRPFRDGYRSIHLHDSSGPMQDGWWRSGDDQGVWKPTDADAIQDALASLQESQVFDAKAEVPGPKKATDFAVDVAAMANDGGSIVYGIAEDTTTGSFTASPIVLGGQSERLSDVVQQLIQDPPRFQVWDVPLRSDPTRGF